MVGQNERARDEKLAGLSKSIKSISFYNPVSAASKPNIVPFAIIYTVFLYVYATSEDYSTLVFYTAPFLVAIHVVTFLAQFWSVDYHAFMSFRRVHDVKDAAFVKVVPIVHRGNKELCPIQRENGTTYFLFQKRKYVYSPSSGTFQKVLFPVANSLASYQKHQGLAEEDVKRATEKWGDNQITIPVPTLKELFKEQALAPFFAFQMFCVSLWLMDEYWQYSLFTLFMLIVFELTVAGSRLRNMVKLRDMAHKPPQMAYVYRSGLWLEVQTDKLLPGDLVSVTRADTSQAQTEVIPAPTPSSSALGMRPPASVQVKAPKRTGVVPCDMLLLAGGCVVNEAMLTGESTPHHKEPLPSHVADTTLSMKNDKLHVLYGGTTVVQQTTGRIATVPPPPDDGCIAYVLRTGFDTTEGRLMRTILFSSTRATANTLEALLFICFLLIFAIAASAYVLHHGLYVDTTRSRYRLFLNCTFIITSVVPPELPMELSVAVNNSLIALARFGIFCTEPFRIPFGGKVDVCCFDKTGTLTTDDLVMTGVAGLDICEAKDIKAAIKAGEPSTAADGQPLVTLPDNLPNMVNLVLAGCQSLVFLDNKLVGDPMETATLNAIQWTLSKNDTASANNGKPGSVRVLHRFHFSSALQRMSTVVSAENMMGSGTAHYVVAKGAPEVMQRLFETVPEKYEATYKHFSRRGQRVLALGMRPLGRVNDIKHMPREDAEKKLTFVGFVLFTCPFKPDAIQAIQMLRESSHRLIMITGDNALTACQVAADVGMTAPTPALVLQKDPASDRLAWVSVDESITIPFEDKAGHLPRLSAKHPLCIPGPCLAAMLTPSFHAKDIGDVKVFARVSPDQKELILTTLKNGGYTTLMAGDGTNDVGALKQAHVGVAILNKGEIAPPRPPPRSPALAPAQTLRNRRDPNAQAQALRDRLKEMETAEEVPIVKLGDASIAAPFTSKSSAVIPVTHIIRQGRCTLVTTLQMYRILALNCLVSAYSLSVLYIDGVKNGDTQATIAGMLIAMCFLFNTRSIPMERLSKERPERSVFSLYMIVSIIGQFIVHLYSLIYCVQLAKDNTPADAPRPNPDGDFTPNLINSTVFLISCASQVANFAVNYRGRPFMQSLTENKGLLYCLIAVGGITLTCASESMPDLNEYLEIVPFPSDTFRTKLMSALVLDFVCAWVVEHTSRLLFNSST